MSKSKVWLTDLVPFNFALPDELELTEKIKRRVSEIGNIPQLEIDDISAGENVGIRHALITAGTSYCIGLNDACIVFSSIAVECVLNWDARLEQDRLNHKPYAWLDVDNKNLWLANDKGLPVNTLLYDGETLADLSRPNKDPVKFVKLRNKYVHGEYNEFHCIVYGTEFHEFKTKEELEHKPVYPRFIFVSPVDALGQLKHAINFITAWAQESPDIVIAQS